MTRRGMALLLASLLLLTASGCAGFAEERNGLERLGRDEEAPKVEFSAVTPEEEPSEEDAPEETSASYYDQLYEAAWKGEEICRINGATGEEIESDLYRVMDEPEIFWIESCETNTYSLGNVVSYVEVHFVPRYTDVAEKQAALERVVREFLQTIPEGATDYDKAKIAHDYLIDRITYGLGEHQGQDIYSALVEQLCVCNGYANAYVYLLERMDIPCGKVAGEAGGESHAWNWAELNGTVYYTDVTWDDADYAHSEQYSVCYDWFNLTLEDMASTHFPKEGETVPEAAATDYNYYTMEDAWLWQYSADAVAEIFARQVGNGTGQLTVRCRNRACYDEMLAGLLDEQAIYPILQDLGYEQSAINYLCEDNLLIFTLLL